MGPLSYPILRIGRYGKGPMNSTDDPYFSTLVGPRTHCFQFVKISLIRDGVMNCIFSVKLTFRLGLRIGFNHFVPVSRIFVVMGCREIYIENSYK